MVVVSEERALDLGFGLPTVQETTQSSFLVRAGKIQVAATNPIATGARRVSRYP